jgi:hypothetical protein
MGSYDVNHAIDATLVFLSPKSKNEHKIVESHDEKDKLEPIINTALIIWC